MAVWVPALVIGMQGSSSIHRDVSNEFIIRARFKFISIDGDSYEHLCRSHPNPLRDIRIIITTDGPYNINPYDSKIKEKYKRILLIIMPSLQ